jgi:hypothetical protein
MNPACDLLHNATRLICGVAALSVLAVLAFPAAAQQPVIQPGEVLTYFFAADDDPTVEHGIKDRSSNGHNGTDMSFATEFALLPGHNPATGTLAAVLWGDDDPDGSGIYTHTNVGALNISTGPYTCMVWCMRGSFKQGGLAETAGEQALFATSNQNPFLMLGFRNAGVEFRHWINGDSGSSTGVDLMKWHHLAYRYDPGTRNQDIFIDGVMVSTAKNGPFADPNQILMIGRCGRGESFAGLIEYPRIFNVALTDAQIAAAAKDQF